MLHPFGQLLQHCWGHAPPLRIQIQIQIKSMVYKDLWAVSFHDALQVTTLLRVFCIRLQSTTNTYATTPNIVGATMLELLRPFARSLSASVYNPHNLHRASPMKLANYTLLVYNRRFFLITLRTPWILLLTKTGWTTVWIFWLNIRNILWIVPSGILVLQRRRTSHRNLPPQIATRYRRSLKFTRKNRLYVNQQYVVYQFQLLASH